MEVFGIHDLGLQSKLFVGGVGEGVVLVEDRDFSFGIFTDHDLGILQGIGWAIGLDLVDDLVVLQGQVFREGCGSLAGEDPIQVLGGKQGTMRIMGAARRNCKAAIEVCSKFCQEGIRGLDGREVA